MNDIEIFEQNVAGQADQIYDYQALVSATGDYKLLSGLDVVINSIRNLLLTPLGSYPFDPTYGSLLYKKVFEPADDATAQSIEFEVRDRIREFEDRISITKVQSTFFENEHAFKVEIYISKKGITGQVTLQFNERTGPFGLETTDDV